MQRESALRPGVGTQPSLLANVVPSVKVGCKASNLCSRVRYLRGLDGHGHLDYLYMMSSL